MGVGDRAGRRGTGGVPGGARAPVAAGGAHLLPPRRAPARRSASVRLPGHLGRRVRRGGTDEAPAVALGGAATHRREGRRGVGELLRTPPAGRGDLRLDPGSSAVGRRLPAAGVAAGARPAAPAQRAGVGGGRPVGPAAGRVAAPDAAAGRGDHRRPDACAAGDRRGAGLRRGRHPRRRRVDARRAGNTARRRRRAGADQGPVGRGRPPAAAAGPPPLAGGAAAGPQRALLHRGHAPARRRAGGSAGRRRGRRTRVGARLRRRCDARGAPGHAPAGCAGPGGDRRRSAGHAAAVSTRRADVVALPVAAGSRRLPGRRHGSGQDHPGSRACCSAGGATTRPGRGRRRCW